MPHVPVLLNGTLIDPQDICRFDGVALHFIAADDHLLATDDIKIISRWWEASYLSAAAESYRNGGYHSGGVRPQINPTFPSMERGGELPPYNPGGSSGEVRPETLLFEHVDYKGHWLTLPKNKAYYDLTEVGAFLDWATGTMSSRRCRCTRHRCAFSSNTFTEGVPR